jgi:hypothetical protein
MEKDKGSTLGKVAQKFQIPEEFKKEFGRDTRTIIKENAPPGIIIITKEHLDKMLKSEGFFEKYDLIAQPKSQR